MLCPQRLRDGVTLHHLVVGRLEHGFRAVTVVFRVRVQIAGGDVIAFTAQYEEPLPPFLFSISSRWPMFSSGRFSVPSYVGEERVLCVVLWAPLVRFILEEVLYLTHCVNVTVGFVDIVLAVR